MDGSPPRLLSVSTSLPPHTIEAKELEEYVRFLLPSSSKLREFFERILPTTGVQSRSLAMDLTWYLSDHGHRDRSLAFQKVGLPLAQRAASKALERASVKPEEIRAVVFVTTTGIATPTLDSQLVFGMGLSPTVLRIPVWGWGCAGGVAGLSRSLDLSRALGGAPVLLISLELCSLTFDLRRVLREEDSLDPDLKKEAIASLLFSDGCASCVVGAGTEGLVPWRAESRIFRQTAHFMGWEVEDETLGLRLSPEIPEFVQANARALLDSFLAPLKIERPDIFLLHPGGPKVLEAYEKALGLSPSDLERAWRVLERHGNMSSPTVLFELEDLLEGGFSPSSTVLLGSLGPGFSSELLLLGPPRSGARRHG